MLGFLVSIYRYIFARAIFRRFNYVIYRLGLSGLGVLNYENDKVSGEQHLISVQLPKIFKNNKPVVLDVGANVGKYSTELISRFPDSVIHSFEPHPKNYYKLVQNLSNTSVTCHNMALGEEPGELVLYDRSDKEGSMHASLHKSVITELHKKPVTQEKVTVETIDKFCQAESIEYIDFLKIDTEGHELSVLKGAENYIKQRKINCIHFEFNEMNVVSHVFLRDFRKVLPQYDFFRLLPTGLLKLDDYPLTTEIFAFQNILALQKERH